MKLKPSQSKPLKQVFGTVFKRKAWSFEGRRTKHEAKEDLKMRGRHFELAVQTIAVVSA